MQDANNRPTTIDFIPLANVSENTSFKTPTPLYEWAGMSSWQVLPDFQTIDPSDNAPQLFELEISYQRAEFGKAIAIADDIIATSEDQSDVLSARATRLLTLIAMGDADAAYESLPEVIESCRLGFDHYNDDPLLYTASLITAMRVEAIMMAQVFDMPPLRDGIDWLPSGLKAYYGYLTALRELRRGYPGKAEGVILASQGVIGVHYPIPRVALMLLESALCVLDTRPEEGEDPFRGAWQLAEETGVIMPFVELNYVMCGMPRRCLLDRSASLPKRIEALVRQYHKGWYGLRKKCGIEDVGETLTPVEWYVMNLAGLGWRNKEIAAHLRISENTVKHQLTSCYQKVGITGRAGIRALMKNAAISQSVEL